MHLTHPDVLANLTEVLTLGIHRGRITPARAEAVYAPIQAACTAPAGEPSRDSLSALVESRDGGGRA